MSLFGYLALVAGVAVFVFGAFAYIFVNRLQGHAATPISEENGSFRKVLGRLRKDEPMAQDEIEFAAQTIADRGSLLAYSLPAAVFSLGCVFLFGGLEVHGVSSLRPYIGLFPMLGAVNMTIQLCRIAALKERLRSCPDCPRM